MTENANLTADWLPFRYVRYWDIPRNILVRYHNRLFLFDCLLDDALDDYPDVFTVHEVPDTSDAPEKIDWLGLTDNAIRTLGTVPVAAVRFDPTLRGMIDPAVFDLLPASASPTPSHGLATHDPRPVVPAG